MTFATPWLLAVAIVAPVVVLMLQLYDRARRRQLTSRLGELPVIGKVIASASPGRRIGKDVLAGAAAMLRSVAGFTDMPPNRSDSSRPTSTV